MDKTCMVVCRREGPGEARLSAIVRLPVMVQSCLSHGHRAWIIRLSAGSVPVANRWEVDWEKAGKKVGSNWQIQVQYRYIGRESWKYLASNNLDARRRLEEMELKLDVMNADNTLQKTIYLQLQRKLPLRCGETPQQWLLDWPIAAKHAEDADFENWFDRPALKCVLAYEGDRIGTSAVFSTLEEVCDSSHVLNQRIQQAASKTEEHLRLLQERDAELLRLKASIADQAAAVLELQTSAISQQASAATAQALHVSQGEELQALRTSAADTLAQLVTLQSNLDNGTEATQLSSAETRTHCATLIRKLGEVHALNQASKAQVGTLELALTDTRTNCQTLMQKLHETHVSKQAALGSAETARAEVVVLQSTVAATVVASERLVEALAKVEGELQATETARQHEATAAQEQIREADTRCHQVRTERADAVREREELQDEGAHLHLDLEHKLELGEMRANDLQTALRKAKDDIGIANAQADRMGEVFRRLYKLPVQVRVKLFDLMQCAQLSPTVLKVKALKQLEYVGTLQCSTVRQLEVLEIFFGPLNSRNLEAYKRDDQVVSVSVIKQFACLSEVELTRLCPLTVKEARSNM